MIQAAKKKKGKGTHELVLVAGTVETRRRTRSSRRNEMKQKKERHNDA